MTNNNKPATHRMKECSKYNEQVAAIADGNLAATMILYALTDDLSSDSRIYLYVLDDAGIYGQQVWRLYKDCCNANLNLFRLTIEHMLYDVLDKSKVKYYLKDSTPSIQLLDTDIYNKYLQKFQDESFVIMSEPYKVELNKSLNMRFSKLKAHLSEQPYKKSKLQPLPADTITIIDNENAETKINRITSGMDLAQIINVMSDGNVGVNMLLRSMIEEDTTSRNQLLFLDAAQIYGNNIWRLFSECSNGNLKLFKLAIEHISAGIFSTNQVLAFLENGIAIKVPLVDIEVYKHFKEKIPAKGTPAYKEYSALQNRSHTKRFAEYVSEHIANIDLKS